MPRSSTADQRLSSKNTSCPALVTVIVRRQFSKLSRSKNKDPLLADFPTLVQLEHTHNHSLDSADFFRHLDVSDATVDKFKDLFSRGHSPASALELHKLDLQLEHGADYLFQAADRSQCPDIFFCHRLYKQVFEKHYGASSGEKMFTDVEAACKVYNTQQGSECCKMERTASGKLAIAVCTQLMQRVHKLHRTSGELVFVDASGGMDRFDCRVFLLLTHSSAGGLPLGCLIVSSESTEVLILALQLYMQLVPSDAFFGRGEKGPEVFITDDSEAERQSLNNIFPEATTILCSFHLLQATWRFLWDSKNGIPKSDRPHLLGIVKNMMYATSEDDLLEVFCAGQVDSVAAAHTKFLHYMERLFDRRKLWAMCYRDSLPIRGNQTNNYVEAAMRVLKDRIFVRTRAYNVVQLVDFLLTRLPAYYERRLMDLANGRRDVTISRRYITGKHTITKDMITTLGEMLFEVQSESETGKSYEVDMATEMCTCKAGLTGAPCKHQFAITVYYNVSALNFFPVKDSQTRCHFYTLATGCTKPPAGWFEALLDNREAYTR
ncbi:hypothetical protein V1264_024257 [Littorina saxatilis]|uniref:SWIM-type domain-containing protein n=2 Tax=Littorina saxatilis TaxID=31220 RepID=A0AAN9AL73_9CAEN